MSNWWPIPWTNPPKGSNQARITLRNGRTFELFDDQGRFNGRAGTAFATRFGHHTSGPKVPVIRYEVREIVNGVMAPTYDRVDTLLELRSLLTSLEQE